MAYLDIKLGDRVEMKKVHPCGAKIWEVIRTGVIVKLKCEGCGHVVTFDRSKAEKLIKKIL